LLALALVSTVVLLTSPASFAAKPAKPTAKQKAASKSSTKAKAETSSIPAPGMEASKPSTEGYKYETPSPALPPTPESPPAIAAVDTFSSAQADKGAAAAPPTIAEKEPAKDLSPAATDRPASLDAPEPVPPAMEEPSAAVEPPPVYVEHLGPGAYPGKLRGIYGGSMWLEPSFNGLQWPYMKRSGVGVSGSIWVDNGYEKITRDAPQLSPTTMYLQQGRAVLRVTPTYASGNFFIQGQVELVGNLCQVKGATFCNDAGTFDTDDLWIRVGHWNVWDLKVGRFEGWELYHTGMGLDINTLERLGATNIALPTAPSNLDAPQFYGVNYLHDRPTAGMGIGYIALHWYPTETLRFEALGEIGTDNNRNNSGNNFLGGRPSVIFDLGWLKVKAGGEYEKVTRGTPQSYDSTLAKMVDSKFNQTKKGAGGSVQIVVDPSMEFGANVAYGKFSSTNDTGIVDAKAATTTISVGGFANFRLAPLWLLGLGANWTTQSNSYFVSANADFADHLQTFGAIQYLLARQLFIKAVIGYSRADFQPSDTTIPIWSSYMYSGRVRLMYLY
jgi:hypothetical protein